MATYSESAEGIEISKARALLELRRHGCGDAQSVAEFLSALGDKATYRASAVLAWLGY